MSFWNGLPQKKIIIILCYLIRLIVSIVDAN